MSNDPKEIAASYLLAMTGRLDHHLKTITAPIAKNHITSRI